MGDCNMNEYTYSIIIPHWNQPYLLNECLKTIPQRRDIEVIVVDDGSDEVYVNELKALVESYSHVKIIFEAKRTAGYARNQGLAMAKGEWLVFADSDDYFLDGFLNILDNYRNSQAQIVYFNTTSVYLNTSEIAKRHIYTNKVLSFFNLSDRRTVDFVRCLLLGPCSKMFKRELIVQNQVLFDDVPVMNDTIFALKAAMCATDIDVSSSVIYCITASANSMISRNSVELIKVRLGVYMRANELYEKYHFKQYKMNVVALIFSARKFGIGAVKELLICARQYYSSACSMYSDLLVYVFKWLVITFKYKLFKIDNYTFYKG
jgi:glycosyltransferase involved in cell wall biosynthesis